MHVYKEETEVEKIYVSNKATVRVYGNCLHYVEDKTHTLKKLTILNGDVKIVDVAKKQTDFEYVATSNSKYAIISKHQNGGIEIDIDGRKGRKVSETTDINYDTMNLQGSVFHRGTLCLASDGKMVSVMPYVATMPISKVITETMISIISKESQLELKQISENRSELYVLNADRNVYKFVM